MALQNIDLMDAEVFEAKLSQYIRGVVQHDTVIGLIKERDRAILEAAAERWEVEWWGFPSISLEELHSSASEEQADEIKRYCRAILAPLSKD